MLKNEAVWIGKEVGKLPKSKIGTILDLGSSSPFFRTIRQPYINKYIFSPLKNRRIKVIHTDIELDVVGGGFVNEVKKGDEIKTVFAFNLLEHVSDYKKATRNISSIVPKGGYLFVSCPKEFPYHLDPIDNGFRPTPDELAGLFPGMKVIKKATVSQQSKLMFTRQGVLIGKKYFASCLVLRKP